MGAAICLNGRQPLAADAAAIGQDGFAALAGVAAQEAVLPLAADFRWLILALHNFNSISTSLRGPNSASEGRNHARRIPAIDGEREDSSEERGVKLSTALSPPLSTAFATDSSKKPSMSFTGTVKDGVIVLPPGLKLPDGLEVQLTVTDSASPPSFADRYARYPHVFSLDRGAHASRVLWSASR